MNYIDRLRCAHEKLSTTDISLIASNARKDGLSYMRKGIRPFNSDNNGIINLVSESIGFRTVDVPFTARSKDSTGMQIEKALSTYDDYDSSVKERLSDSFSEFVVDDKLSDYYFRTKIGYSIILDKESDRYFVDKESGSVDGLFRPKKITVLDPIWYAHEGIHACKETYYDEYIDFLTYSEVIPIFHEMISAHKFGGNIQEQWIAARYHLLHTSKFNRDLYKIEGSIYPKYGIDFTLLSNMEGVYLLDYYYAVLLYQKYRREPDVVIRLVNLVLCGKMTTKELLDRLGLLEHTNSQVSLFKKENLKCLQKVNSYNMKHKK